MNMHPDALSELIVEYFELNGSTIAELDAEPSPLEFMRFVSRNTPFVARGAANAWPAVQTWSVPFLRHALAGETVNVAVTPMGNADAPTRAETGQLVLAKPCEEDQSFPTFLDYVVKQEADRDLDSEVCYAQTQNDNFRHEYAALFGHVQRDISFARIALERPPEAINLWIGNARSVTALHRDNYENIYVQILGRKHFVLLPPLCQPCVNEQLMPPYTYRRRRCSIAGNAQEYGPQSPGLQLEPDPPTADLGSEAEPVPFAIWDPDAPDTNATAYSRLALPIRVTLDPGDMLYLPAMWYHKVSQSCSDEGICVAANYWYDMDFTGPLFPLASFVRSVYQKQPPKPAWGALHVNEA